MATEYTSETLIGKIFEPFVKYPKNLALKTLNEGPEVTFEQLKEHVNAFAAEIVKCGILPGELVSLAFMNTAEFVVAFLGVTRARAVAAPLNPSYTEAEFQFYMEDAKSKLLLLPSSASSSPAQQAASKLDIPVAIIPPLEESNFLKLDFISPLSSPLQSYETSPLPFPLPSDEALFLHTSGTTSRPKGVPLTHENLAASLSNIAATYDLSASDRTLVVMPLYHVHGLMAALLATLSSGGAALLPSSGRFSATTLWKEVATGGATWLTAVPTMLQILLSRHRDGLEPPSGEVYPKLRFVRSCSASLAPAVLYGLEEILGCPVLEAYAMTEASHQMCSNPLLTRGPRKAGTVGKPTGIELAILEPSTGKELPPGGIGEVCIRGKNVTKGYRDNPSANDEAFKYGWFHTGDMGTLDSDGYLSVTGRIKELINRGGEKISPLEVDAALLTHPSVAEAVAFAAPDTHYGEDVNAAVVLRGGVNLTEDDLKEHLKSKLAKFKIPKKIFFAPELPKTATGKIQRRFVAKHFLEDKKSVEVEGAKTPSTIQGQELAALSLARLGVKYIFGVVGIPVTALATSAQKAGIRFIGFRNEQSAGYAASASGFFSGVPAVLLTVSGPGFVHGLAGLSGSTSNTWPLVLISGSSEQGYVGRGDFQELDQVKAAEPYAKVSVRVTKVDQIPEAIKTAVLASVSGRPGGTYVDLPADILKSEIPVETSQKLLESLNPYVPFWEKWKVPEKSTSPVLLESVKDAISLLKSSKRPLLVIGKGAAFSRVENELLEFVELTKIPFLSTPMGKGVVSDFHPNSASKARSLALKNADVALVVGARLNWMLHFGESPKWNPKVKFILVEISPEEVELRKPQIGLIGEAKEILHLFLQALKSDPFELQESSEWLQLLQAKAKENEEKLRARLSKDKVPLDFHCSLRIIRDAIESLGSPAPILVSEGANTMDLGRLILEQREPRTRVDAGTWGTMGVGLGYAIGAAITEVTGNPQKPPLVVALEGDSAFGFSGMELETIVRYKLPIVVIVMNNNGVYGGDRRGTVDLPEHVKNDPAPTAFVDKARYDIMIEAFGGKGFKVETPEELKEALDFTFRERKPALINVIVDPFAGTESGGLSHKN